ncbi:hypothetical protein B0H10DRAFT_449608 [Mycena sp. CBHHK59/15]|nr:hypothetical protein B0H10DRAFT_449608 [Mycena sp. CBHHK59/15]
MGFLANCTDFRIQNGLSIDAAPQVLQNKTTQSHAESRPEMSRRAGDGLGMYPLNLGLPRVRMSWEDRTDICRTYTFVSTINH